MALVQTQISQLYVAIFNRASEGEGNQYWQAQPDAAIAATAMLDTVDAKQYFGSSLDSNQAFIEHIYLNTLNKTLAMDPDGIAYWTGRLEDGEARGQIVVELVGVIEKYAPDGPYYDPSDAATVAAYNQFVNRVEISDYMADQVFDTPADYAVSTAFDKDLLVTDDPDTVAAARAAVDVLAAGDGDGDDDDDEPVDIHVANNLTYDASDGDYNFILNFNGSEVTTKISTINGFDQGDTLTVMNAPSESQTLIQAVSAISEELFYFREGVSGENSWGINMGEQNADLIYNLEDAFDIDDQLDVLGVWWGDWLLTG